MSLVQRIENARTLIRAGRLANEAAVSSGVVLPLLDALGWPAFDPSIVAPEYSVGNRRVDFALLTHGTPAVFIEVKQPGLTNGADRQLFEYAFHEGVPMAVLTDGSTWHVYLPAMQGSYEERRVYLLDLIERDPKEVARILRRYLERTAVESGEAFDRARNDYRRAKQRKGAADAIPQAWANLTGEQHLDILRLVHDEVERISGYSADAADIWTFIAGLSTAEGLPEPTRGPRTPEPIGAAPPPTRSSSESQVGFRIGDTFTPAKNGQAVIIGVFRALAVQHPEFLQRYAALKHGRKRQYLSQSKELLYPDRPELRSHSVEIKPGWWMGTNTSSRTKVKIIKAACAASGLRYGSDVEVWMP
ncbi:MAG: type I restriction endonuclease [Bacteroidota bacterium]